MPQITQPGRYNCYPTQWKVDRSKNGCVQLIVALLAHECDGALLEPRQSITAFLMLTKSNGEKIQRQLDNIMGAFGWDGQRLRDLVSADHSEKEMQAVVNWNEYEGKRTLRVDWLQKPGGFKEVTEDTVDALERVWAGMMTNAPAPEEDPNDVF